MTFETCSGMMLPYAWRRLGIGIFNCYIINEKSLVWWDWGGQNCSSTGNCPIQKFVDVKCKENSFSKKNKCTYIDVFSTQKGLNLKTRSPSFRVKFCNRTTVKERGGERGGIVLFDKMWIRGSNILEGWKILS